MYVRKWSGVRWQELTRIRGGPREAGNSFRLAQGPCRLEHSDLHVRAFDGRRDNETHLVAPDIRTVL